MFEVLAALIALVMAVGALAHYRRLLRKARRADALLKERAKLAEAMQTRLAEVEKASYEGIAEAASLASRDVLAREVTSDLTDLTEPSVEPVQELVARLLHSVGSVQLAVQTLQETVGQGTATIEKSLKRLSGSLEDVSSSRSGLSSQIEEIREYLDKAEAEADTAIERYRHKAGLDEEEEH